MKSVGVFLFAASLLLFGSAAMALEPPPHFLGMWGSEGAALGQFRAPTGVAFDMEGHLVVADSRNARIQLFETDGTPVELLRLPGGADVPMTYPQAVGTCHSGRIYVADTGSNRIWVFERGGLALDDWGGPGAAPGQFHDPGGLAVLPDGSVFVADWGNDRVQRLDGTGACTCEWTPAGVGPYSVACDHLGHVFVADRDGNRIYKYGCSGTLLESWGVRGRAEGEFMRPHGIACDALGNVYVADTYNYRIQKFDNHGRFLTQWGSFGQGPGQFVKVASIAVGHDGTIAVADEVLNRVQVFGTPPEVKAFLDIAPGVCPNVLDAGGSLQVALLGAPSFDALQVDPAKVRFASLSPTLFAIGDVAGLPADRLDPCACATAGGDGLDDLLFTFPADALRSALGGAGTHEVVMTGALRDGTPFAARACVHVAEYATPADRRGRTAVRVTAQTPAGCEIGFTLREGGITRLTAIDVGGRIAARIVNGWYPRGEHRVTWDPGALRSGVYFLRLEAGDQVVVQRFPLTR